jgi:hypothetical protein
VTVYLLPDVLEKASQIGRGNVSGGISEAVREYKHKRTRTVVVGSRGPVEMSVTEWGSEWTCGVCDGHGCRACANTGVVK